MKMTENVLLTQAMTSAVLLGQISISEQSCLRIPLQLASVLTPPVIYLIRFSSRKFKRKVPVERIICIVGEHTAALDDLNKRGYRVRIP